MKYHEKFRILVICLAVSLICVGCANKNSEHAAESQGNDAADQTIVDEWKSVILPPAPKLKPVAVQDKTALLILDMQAALCKNPRSTASIPKISQLLGACREKSILVVYSLTAKGNPEDIVSELAPSSAAPIVKSGVDKFYNTDLGKILHDYGIKTVIITGTAANGAVLHTATSAALRGYQVIIPVDGMSAADLYAEQYTAWHMFNSPGTRNKATLTKVSMMSF